MKPSTIRTATDRAEAERRAIQEAIRRAMHRLATRRLTAGRERTTPPRDALHFI